MAKSKSRFTTNSVYQRTRVAAVNATTSSVVRSVYVVRPAVSYLPALLAGEDRRTFHPDGYFRTPFSSPRSAARLVVRSNVNKTGTRRNIRTVADGPSFRVGFYRPDRVAICVRRKTRRQVIFASGVGGSRVRRGKRNYASGFHCS